jgi:hypothetical protein
MKIIQLKIRLFIKLPLLLQVLLPYPHLPIIRMIPNYLRLNLPLQPRNTIMLLMFLIIKKEKKILIIVQIVCLQEIMIQAMRICLPHNCFFLFFYSFDFNQILIIKLSFIARAAFSKAKT